MDEKEITIESRLKELRKERNLSQEGLADALGISRQSIIAFEQGKFLPSLPMAVSMCRFFDSAFEDLFEFEKEVEEIFDTNKSIKIINSSGLNPERKENKMVDLEPWRPLREAVSLRDAMDRLFEDSFITPAKGGTMPKVDIKEKDNEIMVKAELPGISEDEINVEIMDNIMTISGEKKEEKNEGYYYKESHSGAFSRSFTLPSDVVADKALAEMKNGVLSITVPKVAPKVAKKVKITPKK